MTLPVLKGKNSFALKIPAASISSAILVLANLFLTSKNSLHIFSCPFSQFKNKVIVLSIGFIYVFQPSQPCSIGFKPVLIDVVAAVVVAGKTVVISLYKFF